MIKRVATTKTLQIDGQWIPKDTMGWIIAKDDGEYDLRHLDRDCEPDEVLVKFPTCKTVIMKIEDLRVWRYQDIAVLLVIYERLKYRLHYLLYGRRAANRRQSYDYIQLLRKSRREAKYRIQHSGADANVLSLLNVIKLNWLEHRRASWPFLLKLKTEVRYDYRTITQCTIAMLVVGILSLIWPSDIWSFAVGVLGYISGVHCYLLFKGRS